MNSGAGKYLAAVISMMVGGTLVFGLVILMNRLAPQVEKPPTPEARNLAVVKQPKPKPKKEIKRQKPKPKPRRVTPPAPLAGLDSALSGIDLGLPGLATDDLSDLNDQLLGNTQVGVMTEDSVDVPPRPLSRGSFKYPRNAKKRGITGYVVLSLLIDEDGEVVQVKVLEASPSGIFDASAVTGIKQWQFEPAKYQGKKVKTWAKQKIKFDLG
ncbi:energy transducer TonB [Nitrosococcus wardiae]|uniref:Protein TonB n=1 Tax=Nitrosococcus wardiae TaxID=1814290 RepID=A0A4P7BXS0_9GAMM|nr:energy transducer TonB [Nitrosococcus wardiae]QBQ53920.1 energy transducer TonB [Nitrosococcus wardiae]